MDEKFYKSLVYLSNEISVIDTADLDILSEVNITIAKLMNNLNAGCSTCKNYMTKACKFCFVFDYSKIKEGIVTFKLTNYLPLIKEEET